VNYVTAVHRRKAVPGRPAATVPATGNLPVAGTRMVRELLDLTRP
jgi:hypothetical protein